jgi:hypothetical protein
MKLLYLHGAPAAGKLAVAEAVLRLVPGKLFDNHAAIDVARCVFEFHAPGFWELVHHVRVSVLTAAAGQNVPLVVTTTCYSDPDDLPAFEQFETIVRSHGGQVLPVFLHCSMAEAIRRVGNADRVERRKTCSAEGLQRVLASNNIAPVPRADCLRLDSEARTADATAIEIIRHFGLLSR